MFPRRSDVRMPASMLCVCLALVFAVNMSRPGLLDRAGQIKGTDFSNFYVLGSMALNDQGRALYDRDALPAIAAHLLPESRGMYYLPIYGPQVSLFFAPFAALPYAAALTLWLVITTAIYAVCCWLVWRKCPNLRHEKSTVVIIAAAYPAFFTLLAHGQNSAIVLACFTAACFALAHERRFLAGLAIGTLIFKPQLGLVVACAFIVNREWRIVAGAVIAACLQLALAWLYYGSSVMIDYGLWLRDVGEIAPLLHVKPYQMHSLLAFWRFLVPWENLSFSIYVLTACIVIAAACWVWGSRGPLSLRYAVLLLATVLVSPHVYVYDLVLLAPALLLAADWALGNQDDPLAKPVQRALYFSYVLPLAGMATQLTRVQLSVIAMMALSVMLATVAITSQRRSPARWA